MDSFKTAYADTLLIDPDKRPFYSHGLVLGVGEFVQAETYLLERHRLHNRALHGYGTVCGLALDVRGGDADPEISVSPGLAVNPQGIEIKVADAQCAQLNVWLANHREEVSGLLGSPAEGPPATVELNVVLCAAECLTDKVPVPTGPCQSLDRTMIASRIADDFRLELRTDLSTPEQVEEWAIRDLVTLISSIPVLDQPGGLDAEGIAALVRTLLPGGGAPVAPGSPGGHMTPDMAETLLRTAFLVWVTEVRPQLLPGGRGCAGEPPAERCVLLGRVSFTVSESDLGFRVAGPVTIDEDDRPFLLQTRLLQEMLQACCAHGLALESALAEAAMAPGGMGGGLEGGDGEGGDTEGGGDGDEGGTGEDGEADEDGDDSGEVLLPLNTMFTDQPQTVSATKTFAAPILLEGAGRVGRVIQLRPNAGRVSATNRADLVTFRSLPAVRFRAQPGGEAGFDGRAIFDVPIPPDLDLGGNLVLRLQWSFSNVDMAADDEIPFSWQVRTAFFSPGDRLRPNLTGIDPVEPNGTLRGQDADTLLVTERLRLRARPVETSTLGVLEVRVGRFEPQRADVFLLGVEIDYIADRLGRAI